MKTMLETGWNGTNVLRQTKEMGTASVRLLEAIILLCPKLFFVYLSYLHSNICLNVLLSL
ncbi:MULTISPECIES: hypothetical protein [Priestia]|uniref:hypothetical protein n=1 Tax=Priestia TaxID=2800373 RepID=UPI0012E360C4|nr:MULTISPECIES: hypothetical protein [Priestia]